MLIFSFFQCRFALLTTLFIYNCEIVEKSCANDFVTGTIAFLLRLRFNFCPHSRLTWFGLAQNFSEYDHGISPCGFTFSVSFILDCL